MSSESRLLVYGNGSMARLLISYVGPERVACCTVDRDFLHLSGPQLYGVPVIAFDEYFPERYSPDEFRFIVALGYHGMNSLRSQITLRLADMGYQFESYVHPSVFIGIGASVGSNSIILDHTSIHPGALVGDGVFIGSNVNIGHDVHVGSYCFINSGSALAGWSKLGQLSFCGVNTTIGDNISIGSRNYIGANTLVVKSTGDDEVWISGAGQRFRMSSDRFLEFTSAGRSDALSKDFSGSA